MRAKSSMMSLSITFPSIKKPSKFNGFHVSPKIDYANNGLKASIVPRKNLTIHKCVGERCVGNLDVFL
jgi:hypothetical protein